jgi:uncharacterized membrane protein YwzB
MTEHRCEQEPLVETLIRSGRSTEDLDRHVAACAICAETKEVAELLLQHAAMTRTESRPLAVKAAWRKIQRQKQRFVVQRATNGMVLMRLFAAAYLVAVAAWCLQTFWDLQSAELNAAFRALPAEISHAALAIIFACIALGACCLLFMGNRVDFKLRL